MDEQMNELNENEAGEAVQVDETNKRLEALEKKIDTLFEAIGAIDEGERRGDFHEKWAERIGKVEPDQKTIFGDDYSEEDGLWDYHNKHKDEEGYDEDEVIGGYLDKVEEKFAKLKGQVETSEEAEIVEQKEEEAKEEVEAAQSPEEAEAIIEEKAEEAEDAIEGASEDEPDEDEVNKALEEDILISL